jgi:hypothetical protein
LLEFIAESDIAMAEPVYEQIQSPGHHFNNNPTDKQEQKLPISMTECPAYQATHSYLNMEFL